MEKYIGITGFKNIEEVESCKILTGTGTPRIMYGVLTSPKNLRDEYNEGSRIASLKNLEKIFSAVPKKDFPMIHHCTDNRRFVDELNVILSYDGIYEKELVKAVQINQRLPEVKELEKLKRKYGKLEVVLQLEPPDLARPKETAKKMKEYEGLIEYVIIDPSRGAGIELSVENTLEVLTSMKTTAMPVITGGLSSKNVFDVVKFFRQNYGEEFCIDAEGRLRTEDDEGLIPLELTLYVNKAREAYR